MSINNIFSYINYKNKLQFYGGFNIMKDTSLDKLDIDKSATISTLHCNGDLRRRLLDLGLVNRNEYKGHPQKSYGKSDSL